MTTQATPAPTPLRPMLIAACGLILSAASPPPASAPQTQPHTEPHPIPATPAGVAKPDAASTPAAPSPAPAPNPAVPSDPLQLIGHSDKLVWAGVAIAPDGRIFTCYPRYIGNPGPSVATIGADGNPVPYPGGAWNSWSPGDTKRPDPAPAFVGVSAIRLASDNALWVLDSGVPAFGKPPLPHATKLVRFDLLTNSVTRVLELPPETLRPKSLIGNIRLNGTHAYLTDSGAPGLVVIDLDNGKARRVLDGDPSTTGQRPVIVDGAALKGPDSKPAMPHAAILEVTPDGKFLYVQPTSGPLYRIPTSRLDDATTSPQDLAGSVTFWYDAPSAGGSAVGPDGVLYLEDLENDSVLALSAGRELTTILQDPRLHWPGAPFLRDGVLRIAVEQYDRVGIFHHGKSQVQFPLPLLALRVATQSPARAARP